MLYITLATLMLYQTTKLDKASFDLLTEKPVSSFTSKKLEAVPEAPATEAPQNKTKRWRYKGQSGC
jgi:hypothetical protein